MKRNLIIIGSVLFVIIILVLYVFELKTPANFPVDSMYTVEKGVGLNSLAIDLKEKNIIKSTFWFKVFSVLFGGPKGVIAGDYVLADAQNTIILAKRISSGDFELIPVKITIPEGLNVFETAKLFAEKFSKIKESEFIALAKNDEGYLFPDTYLFLPNISTEEVISIMKDNYKKRIGTIEKEILSFNKPISDVIKMSSIVEEEARTIETRRIIAGILWKRLALGMPLQVDSSFKYINGKGTKELTLEDLKINSPYNSYLYKGLPPTPISNPGLEAIKDTVTPIKTDYLYFLTDKNGDMHYAKTFSEHLRNKELYL